MNTVDADGVDMVRRIETTPGRMFIMHILPRSASVPVDVLNKILTKKDVQDVIDLVYRHCGQKDTVIFADRLDGSWFLLCLQGGNFLR